MQTDKLENDSPTIGNAVLHTVVGSKKYQIIYADPAWSIQTTSQVPSGRPNSMPYRAMRMCDIVTGKHSKIGRAHV